MITRIFIALMLLVSISASAQNRVDEPEYLISVSDSVKNGKITPNTTASQANQWVSVTCEPNEGYGLSMAGLYYAKKNPDGSYSAYQKTENTSSFEEDRANTQSFRFKMPAADVRLYVSYVPVLKLVIHQNPTGRKILDNTTTPPKYKTGGSLVPLYGYKGGPSDSVLYNVAGHQLILKIEPDTINGDKYELADLDIKNVDKRFYTRTDTTITITMPNDLPINDPYIHVTPYFGKENYTVRIEGNPNIVKCSLSTSTPKANEEVTVTLLSKAGYIPAGFSVKGCSGTWWRVGKPEQQEDGGWKVVYRFKVGYNDDITVHYENQEVCTIKVNDTQKTGRVEAIIPEMIPDFPNVALKNQQVPVLLKMPKGFSATYTTQGSKQAPVVYRNALQNSFAEKGMNYWKESSDYATTGCLHMTTDSDADGNYYWRTSVKNSMSQEVDISGINFPDHAKPEVNGVKMLSIAALASINPRYGSVVKASIESVTDGFASIWDFADLEKKEDGWQTVFKTGLVDTKTSKMRFIVSGASDDPTKKKSYDGPEFSNLCLLLPVAGRTTIENEDVLIITTDSGDGNKDVTINLNVDGSQDMATANQKEHAKVTIRNDNTKKEGESVKIMKDDLIYIKGTYDEGYAIYNMIDARNAAMQPDSVNVKDRAVYYHYFVREGDGDITFTPEVDQRKIKINNQYGGRIEVDAEKPAAGQKVVVTVKPNAGCTLKQIRTIPAGAVTFAEDKVDATTRGGTYSFTMPTSYVTLIPEYIVPITSANQIDSISRNFGEFQLAADLDLGNGWDKDGDNPHEIDIYGEFDGKGHQITYAGTTCLFNQVMRQGAVRHLRVKGNVSTSSNVIGGITALNIGIIEDCEVTGSFRNTRTGGTVGGIAGNNRSDMGGGIIAFCHVACDALEAQPAYGIAYQQKGATIRGNVFTGSFSGDGDAYMISNDMGGSTIEYNYCLVNSGNAKAILGPGVTAAQPEQLVKLANEQSAYPVFAASIKGRYDGGYAISVATTNTVRLVNLSAAKAVAGTVVTATVSVSGNNHLASVTVSAADGSNVQSCTFKDNTDNTYTFSFVMPAYDVRISFATEAGRFIYTVKQFIAIDDVQGTYYLGRDLDLYNWERKITLNGEFDGRGHTIRYHGEGNCMGLFKKIRRGSLLERLRVVGFVETTEDCGGIVYEHQGTMRDCHFTGSIKKLTASPTTQVKDHIAALACLTKKGASIDYCSATGKLACAGSQQEIDSKPLCSIQQEESKVTNSYWVRATDNAQSAAMRSLDDATRKAYLVYSTGILDRINPRVIVGQDTIRMEYGKTLDKLTLVDGDPFRCTSDIKVRQVVYQRKATTDGMEPWVLPFSFNRIAANGSFEYKKAQQGDDKRPKLVDGGNLTLSGSGSSLSYHAYEPWAVKSDAVEYVLTSTSGPITIKATDNNRIMHYESALDRGSIYVTYDSIPATTSKTDVLYGWDGTKREFYLCGEEDAPADIQPYRFYAQFYNQTYKEFVTYGQTSWSKTANGKRAAAAAPRRAASVVADGWQPIFLDPRQPQSVTARMLDYYEVAYLTDMRTDAIDTNGDKPVSVVSLVYQKVDDRMELPVAIPLLVRAKRSDALPLTDAETGAEIDALMTLSVITDDGNINEELSEEELDFDMPHYWCNSFGKRLDVWPLPSPEQYADIADTGCMLFEDSNYDQSFLYTKSTDTRTTVPMSYCITVIDSDTYELLPLLDDRVTVEFIGLEEEATGISSLTAEPAGKSDVDSPVYNLNGQRVNASYKGIILKNGRKYIKR